MLMAALLAISATLATQENDLDELPREWLMEQARYGLDITLDGTVWIPVTEQKVPDLYGVRAKDLLAAHRSTKRVHSFWLRGYHARNADVEYQETKGRYTVDCDRETIRQDKLIFYGVDGTILEEQGPQTSSYVVPGTYGATYLRMFCSP